MSKKPSRLSKQARTTILCGSLIVSGIIGALIPFSSIVGSIDNDKGIRGSTEAEATVAASNNSTEEAASPTRKEYTLIAQDADLEIAPGKVVKTWTFKNNACTYAEVYRG